MVADRFFTQQQQLSFLRDEAIFSETLHQRKRAVMELVKSCGDIQTAAAILSEIIDSCPQTGDADFKRFCQAVRSEMQARFAR